MTCNELFHIIKHIGIKAKWLALKGDLLLLYHQAEEAKSIQYQIGTTYIFVDPPNVLRYNVVHIWKVK